MFVINLTYLYIVQLDSVHSLQKHCREKYINFHSLRHFLQTVGEIEKKRIQLDIEFYKILEKMDQTTSTEWKSEYSSMCKNEFKDLF